MHFKQQSYSLSSHLYAASAAASSQRFLPLFLFVLNKNQMEVLPPPDERLRLRCVRKSGWFGAFFMLCIEYTYTHISINEILPAADPPVVISTPSLKTIFLCENWEYLYALVTFTLWRLRNLKSQNEPRMALLRQKYVDCCCKEKIACFISSVHMIVYAPQHLFNLKPNFFF